MKFKIKYAGGISDWHKPTNCSLLINENSVTFLNLSIFGKKEFVLLYADIIELRYKVNEEINLRGGLNKYVIGKYILRSNFLGAVGASLGMKKIEIGTFRIIYISNGITNVLKFICKKGASVLFNELQKKIR